MNEEKLIPENPENPEEPQVVKTPEEQQKEARDKMIAEAREYQTRVGRKQTIENCKKYWKKSFFSGGRGEIPIPPDMSGIPILLLGNYQLDPKTAQKSWDDGFKSLPPTEQQARIDAIKANQEKVKAEVAKHKAPDYVENAIAGMVPAEQLREMTVEEKFALYKRLDELKPKIIIP